MPSRFLRGRWRVLLLLVPALVTAFGGLAAILIVEGVRDDARHQGTIAAVAQANATQVKQASVSVAAVGMLLGQERITDTESLTGALRRLRANNELQSTTLQQLVGSGTSDQAVLDRITSARAQGVGLLRAPITEQKLLRAAGLLSVAAQGLTEIQRNAESRERATDRRADTVTLVVLGVAVLTITGSWWVFLVFAGRMQRRHVEALEHLAAHDPLTGLANRRALDTTLHDVTAPALVAVADLDGFKPFNDRFGHHAGDALLQRLALRLTAVATARGGQAFRLGGDEFCVVVPGGDPAELASACREALRDDTEDLEVGGSVGVAALPDDGDSLDAVWRVADERLYDAKREHYLADPAVDRRQSA